MSIEKLEAQIAAVEAKLKDEVSAVEGDVRDLLIECRSWLEAHLLHLRATPSSPALTDADAAADLAGTSRPDSAAANPAAANEARPEPLASA